MADRLDSRDGLTVFAAGATIAAAAWTVTPIFAGSTGGILVLAAALPTLVALATWAAGARQFGPTWATGPSVRLVLDIVLTVVLISTRPADAGGHAALGGLISGASRLLTVALPAPAAGPEIGVTVAIMALAAGIATELALRTRRSLAPVVPAVVVVAAALLVGSGGATPLRWAAPLVIAVAGAAVVLGGLRGEDAAGSSVPRGRLAAAGVVVVIVAAVLVPAGTHLPGAHARKAYVLRSAVAIPPQPHIAINPISQYAGIHDGTQRTLLTVSAQGQDLQGQYWRLAVLDNFDGATWDSSAIFRPGSGSLPPGPKLAVPTQKVTASVTLYSPTSYLPAPARPTSISLRGVDVDEATGELAPTKPLGTPTTYKVTSEVPDPSKVDLLDATIPTGDPSTGAPPIPTTIASLAQSLVSSSTPTPWDRLLKLVDYLQMSGGFSVQPVGKSSIGSGYFQIQQLLKTKTGSAEQFAATFAVMARAIGFHTRLAVGYVNPTAGANGQVNFSTANYLVWPEVELDGIGWEPIPVLPSTSSKSPGANPNPVSNPVAAAITQQRKNDQAPPPPPAGKGHGPAQVGPHHHPASSGGGLPAWLAAIIAVFGAGLLVLLALLGVKLLRARRQRKATDPGARLAGAWEHALDRLSEFGVPVTASLTATEVAAEARTQLGADRAAPIVGLVPFVDAARYDRRFPPTPASADAAWVAAGQLDTALRQGTPIGKRIQARLSIAPFRRRRTSRALS